MKKLLITLLLLTAVTMGVNAAKSSGIARVFSQPDGTSISVKLLGDESFNWYQTMDGVLLTRVDNVFYIANVTGSGTLENTGILAHNADARSAEETAKASAQDKNTFFTKGNASAKARRKAIADYPSTAAACPHTGNIHIPVILMSYTDKALEFDRATFINYFNGTGKNSYSSQEDTKYDGYSSVAQYFADASYGQFTPVFDVYGPYTADHNHNYYGSAQGVDRELSLLKEAVKKADNDIDFSKYDSNNDNNVDMVYIVYAGTGANLSNDNNDFWPACWFKSAAYTTADGKKINVIGGANELAAYATTKNNNTGRDLRAGIGVTCHEMSHGLGLPDLYNTTVGEKYGEQYNNAGPEFWDLMDGGENIYNGMWPCQYTAWESEIMGWLNVEELKEPADITIYPLNKEGGKAYRVTNPANQYEYYIIENYQSDEWNAYLNSQCGSGLMITHVNATESGLTMAPNNTLEKPNVTIIPADGYILSSYNIGHTVPYKGIEMSIKTDTYWRDLAGDPYPGTSDVTSLAAYNNYTGDEMVTKYPITDITQYSDGSISFKFMGGSTSAISSAITDNTKTTDNRIYTIDGRYVGTSKKDLPSGLYIMNGKKFAM